MLEIKNNEPLKNHTSFHIGGSAKHFTVAKNQSEFLEAIAWAENNKLKYKVIGGGSNILVSDDGFDGLIIKYFGGVFEFDGETVETEAGVPLVLLLNESLKRGLLGLEWAIGIPGTVGGAICNNAGAYGGEMSQGVISVKVLIGGEIKEIVNSACKFGYRESAFKNNLLKGVILSAKLQLRQVADEELTAAKDKMQNNLADRLSKSAEGGSVGSTFRNIILNEEEIAKFKERFPEFPDQFVDYQKVPAAWLIEGCELKGKKIGGAMVSEKHAGKITNIGGATAKDVIMLISIVKQKVRGKYGLQLMEELEYLGF